MNSYVIDKITEGIAHCECLETGAKIEIMPLAGAKEGDVIRPTSKGHTIDREATKNRIEKMQARLKGLFGD